jgi:anaerobic selenocysteine-containing dehydrogenase
MRFKAIPQESLPEIEVWANPQDMIKLGLEDNSTVTLRSV